MRPSAILIGLLAGFATALLFAGVVVQSSLAIFLSLAAPLPIIIASLGWGSPIGFLAALAAGGGLGVVTGSTMSGALLFASIALPAAVVGHIAGLARPVASDAAGNPALDWFPVPRILLGIALVAILACTFTGWLVGYDPVAVGNELGEMFASQVGENEAARTQLQEFARQVVRIIPFLQPALLTLVLATSLYLGGAITRLSGKLARPRDDIPATAGSLPKLALPLFGLALAASFAPGAVGMIGAVATGSLGMAFTLSGLAAIHRMTRATRSRGLILFALYMSILFLTFPLVVATVLGLSETAKRRPAPPSIN
ncbi:hypothetical protein [Aureimonas leprariae]|uniref:DUF2232 domain-containing protein n=1 Tax=Plantimonas leprariae TaxID=2615207 RepID=A0A7V7PQM0_9HYPH|nr:hypothetical protein [Aureimonas leprariae]KAB0680659.1 hypothetical protein F6X38_06530 [Aureimonas leprariae]